MLRPNFTKPRIVAIFATVVVLHLIVGHYFGSDIKFLLGTRVLSDIESNCTPTTLPIVSTPTSQYNASSDTIPNIVHYVWLLNGREHFSLDFKTFISVYSASVYFQPDTIYIHTDATPAQWDYAKTQGDDYTRWTLSIPSVTHNRVSTLNHTLSCRRILKIEHKSDFVRTQQLHRYGGVYMDTDVIPLRDVKVLRESGFANVMGIEMRGRINNGLMVGRPGSALLSIFMSEQHRVFDNRWTTHSVELLSTLAYRLQAVPAEVLILGIQAFTPSGWKKSDIEALFTPHTETEEVSRGDGSLLEIPTSFQDAADYWNGSEWEGRAEWEVDYSGSYAIHAFDGKPEGYWPKRVDLEYVMARQSNYARAVYPAVKHAVDAGIINRKLMDNDGRSVER
ncbi:hypothetical protein V496_09195 [Pseudogymnoascus sp. VKM F-4515 (FW-2607)]|nr:hypothetical protein V496_09195 [Pseudogymnoascus sp. VKM F-4515 (FW-2607)]